MKKMIFLNLAGPFTEGLTYRENIMPKYFSIEGYNTTVIATMDQIDKKNNGFLINANHRKLTFTYYDVIRLEYKFKFLTKRIYRKLRFYQDIISEIKLIDPDLVYINGLQFGSLTVLENLRFNNPNLKIFAELNATYENSARSFFSKFLHKIFYGPRIRKSIKFIDELFFGSESAFQFSKEYYNIDSSMNLLTLGVDDLSVAKIQKLDKNIIFQRFNLLEDEKIVITGGKLDNDKKIIELILSFKMLNYNNLKLLIFGSVSPEIEVDFFNLTSNTHNIEFLGWLEQDEIYKLMSISSLAVFPGTKSALWESAVAFGLPLIASSWFSMDYIDFGGNVIYLTDNWELSELKLRLSDLLDNKKLLIEMRNIASSNWFANLSYSSIVKKALSKLD